MRQWMTVAAEAEGHSAEMGLLRRLSTPLWVLDLTGRVLWLNDRARFEMDLSSDHPAEVLRAEVPSDALGRLTRSPSGGPVRSSVTLRIAGLPDDGTAPALDCRLSLVVLDHPGFPCGPIVLAEGESGCAARRRGLGAMLEGPSCLRALLENAADLILVVDADGAIRYASPSVESVLGLAPDALSGKPLSTFLGPEEGAATMAIFAGLAAVPGERAEVALRLMDAQGRWRCFDAVCTSLVEDPAVGGIVVNAHDVTERRHAEVETRASRDLLMDALESISEGFVLYDPEDRVILCNSRFREMYGLLRDVTLPGTPFETILRTGAARGQYRTPPAGWEVWFADRMERRRNPRGPFELPLGDGRWMRIAEHRTWDGGTVSLHADITDLKQREAELSAAREAAEQANRRKSDYVHHLSHELRTPLNAVIGFSQIIADEMMGPLGQPRYRDQARQIAVAGHYMLDLVNNILDLAKLEAGRMELVEEQCSLPLLVSLTLDMMGGRAQEAGVELGVDLPDDLPDLTGDPSLIRQMLTNLIANAIKFTYGEDARVMVGASRTADGGLAVCVADNGIGMAADQIPQALDVFGQVHGTGSRGQRGTGLGLPLTCGLIRLHGGELGIESAPGQGTRVTLAFPPSRVVASG